MWMTDVRVRYYSGKFASRIRLVRKCAYRNREMAIMCACDARIALRRLEGYGISTESRQVAFEATLQAASISEEELDAMMLAEK